MKRSPKLHKEAFGFRQLGGRVASPVFFKKSDYIVHAIFGYWYGDYSGSKKRSFSSDVIRGSFLHTLGPLAPKDCGAIRRNITPGDADCGS